MNNSFSQDFINKSKTEVENFLEAYSRRVNNLLENNDTIQFDYIEEDEINRVFDVSYYLVLSNDTCKIISKKMPYHEYWINTILDQINQRNAKGEGDKLDIEGESLMDSYIFNNYSVEIKYLNDSLFFKFSSKL